MRRPLYGWLASETVSITGTRVSMIALPFFVLSTTGSAEKAGLVALAEMLPLVLVKALGGPVIDRLGARRVSIGCDLMSVAVIAAVPLAHAAGRLPFPALLALVFLAGALRGPGDAAKHALTPTLVAHAGVPMERATGLHSTVERTASMLGAALAGSLVAVIGPANALLVDAASFCVSAALLAWATAPLKTLEAAARTGVPTRAREAPSFLKELKEGWTFLRGDRVLVGITLMVALTNMLDIAYASVLVPVWGVEKGGGAAVVGLVFAVFSGASALGALCAAAWAAKLPRYGTYLVAFLVSGAPRFIVMGFESPLWSVLTVSVAGGFAAGFINPVLGAVMYERIPPHLVGRVTSLTSAACYALMPFGGLLAGLLVGGVGLTATMVACGVAYLVFTMLPALDPRWRQLDHAQRVASPTRSASRNAREMAPPSSATSTST